MKYITMSPTLTAYKVLYEKLNLPFEYEEVKNLCIAGIKRQNAEIVSSNELGNLWNAMTYLYEEGMIFADGDFKVKYIKMLKTDRTEREYKTETPILMLRLNHFIGQYKKMAKQQGEVVMSKDSIRYYLTTSGAYQGMKASERWKVFQDGKPMTEVKIEEGGVSKQKFISKFDRCLCFDYQALKDKFDLNLESVSAEFADIKEKEEIEAETREFNKRREPDMFKEDDEDKDPF